MVYVYNAGAAPHHMGSLILLPKRYFAVSEETAEKLKHEGARILVEGQPGYEDIWVRRSGQHTGP